MLLSTLEFSLVMISFLIIATLYSSVGFGGGSSYLALLALVFASFFVIRSVALVCNLIVVSGSTYHYWRKGLLDLKNSLPFALVSIPMAFFGARFKLQENTFFILLGFSLIVAAFVLIYQTLIHKSAKPIISKYPPYLAYIIGGVIGLLSGLVGIGGGIFLAPILHYMRWDKSIKIAALASFFILVNSISGLGGLVTKATFQLPFVETLGLIVAVFLGGQIGIRLCLSNLTANGIKVVTGLLVLFVGIRVLAINGFLIEF